MSIHRLNISNSLCARTRREAKIGMEIETTTDFVQTLNLFGGINGLLAFAAFLLRHRHDFKYQKIVKSTFVLVVVVVVVDLARTPIPY
jgi:hypothetical protein